MIDSRDIGELHPFVQAMCRQHIDECAKQGLRITVYATYRSSKFQDSLYAKGRTAKGNIVTNAKGGQSYHNWRVAYDAAPLDDNGKINWSTTGESGKRWRKMGEIGRSIGLEWGGDWKFVDMPHFQYTQGLHWRDFQAGKNLT